MLQDQVKAIVVQGFYPIFSNSMLPKLYPNNDPFSKLSFKRDFCGMIWNGNIKKGNTGAIQEMGWLFYKKFCDLVRTLPYKNN